jgi:hypothetical protein
MTFCRVLCLGSCTTPLQMGIISEPPRVAKTTEMMGTRMCNSTPFHMEHSEFGWSPEKFGGVLDAKLLLVIKIFMRVRGCAIWQVLWHVIPSVCLLISWILLYGIKGHTV